MLAWSCSGLPLVCSAMRSFPFPGDVLLQWHACELLCHVANASPADYTQLAVKEGALVLVTGAMRGFPAHPQLQAAGCWFLDTCAALQPLHEMLMREHVVSVRYPSCFCFCFCFCSCSRSRLRPFCACASAAHKTSAGCFSCAALRFGRSRTTRRCCSPPSPPSDRSHPRGPTTTPYRYGRQPQR